MPWPLPTDFGDIAAADVFAAGAVECWRATLSTGAVESCDVGMALAIGTAKVGSCELTARAAPNFAEPLLSAYTDCEREQANVKTMDSVSR